MSIITIIRRRIFCLGMILIIGIGLVVSPPSAYADSTVKKLNIPIYIQAMDEWCWAASSKSVSVFLGGSDATQCQYVRWGKGSSECHNVPGDFYADVERALLGGGISNPGIATASTLSYGMIQRQINAGKPIMMRWAWESSGKSSESSGNNIGHILVINGYDASLPAYPMLTYMDPTWDYYRISLYDWVKHSDDATGQDHTWTHTRYNIGK